jgi:hypothetical protein
MRTFHDHTELLKIASKLVHERISALERDATVCLTNKPYAPFPAILYCFSTIDLLGALAAGDARSKRPSTEQSKDFMQHFMGYSEEQARLLQKVFRHKLVHLASPKPAIRDGNRRVAFGYSHGRLSEHLAIRKLPHPVEIGITPQFTVEADHAFNIGMAQFVDDIARGGREYLQRLRTDSTLRGKFQRAFLQLYHPSA